MAARTCPAVAVVLRRGEVVQVLAEQPCRVWVLDLDHPLLALAPREETWEDGPALLQVWNLTPADTVPSLWASLQAIRTAGAQEEQP